MLSPLIRLATRADLPALEWDGELSRFRRLYSDVFDRCERGEALIWIAELEGVGLVGQVFVHLKSQRAELADGRTRAYLYGFRVRPSYRGNGIGGCLMAAVENDLFCRGFQTLSLNVGRANSGAKRLYERLNYLVIGADAGRWHYTDDKGLRHEVHEPAWRMEKNLLATRPLPC